LIATPDFAPQNFTNQDFTNQDWSPPHEDIVLQQI
jgi:hypothetical protein